MTDRYNPMDVSRQDTEISNLAELAISDPEAFRDGAITGDTISRRSSEDTPITVMFEIMDGEVEDSLLNNPAFLMGASSAAVHNRKIDSEDKTNV